MAGYGWMTYTVRDEAGGGGADVAAVQAAQQNRIMRDMLGRFVPVEVRTSLFKMPEAEKQKTKYLHSTGSPSCCGIHWLTSFPEIPRVNGKYDYVNNDHLRTDVDEDLKKIFSKASVSHNTWEGTPQVYVNNIMLVVLNNVQRKLYHDILLKHGFNVIQEEAFTDKTGHLLTIYSKLKHPNVKEATDK